MENSNVEAQSGAIINVAHAARITSPHISIHPMPRGMDICDMHMPMCISMLKSQHSPVWAHYAVIAS